MKIQKIDLSKLRNEEHYQFHTDFKKLVIDSSPVSLGIEVQFQPYLPLYVDEVIALNIIRKSSVTDDLEVNDSIRDATFRGLRDAVKAAANHFKPEVKQAAYHLQKVFKHYGDLTLKPFDEETAAIYSLVADFKGSYASDAAIAGITDWVTELKKNNDSFDTLKHKNYPEGSSKNQLRMKEVRTAMDTVYYSIVNHINALITVNGESDYLGFMNQLNQHIANYTLIYAERKGSNAKNINDTIIETK